jgi:2-aminoadipate transaminase
MRLPSLDRPLRHGAPVYRQLAEHIRAQIQAGDLSEGERLPPIRSLAEDLQLNRDTVASAYEALAGEGLIDSVVGRGTFVRSRSGSEPLALSQPLPLATQVERLLNHERARPRFPHGDGLVSLHTLIPDPAFYPVEAFRRAFNRVLGQNGPELFVYAGPQGHPGLREALAARFREVGMQVDGEEVVLCHGASQGISLAMRLFAQSGDSVAVEVPTYHNVLGTLVGLGLQPVPIPMRKNGPDLDVLESAFARPEVKAFYTIPSFHNPMGTTIPLTQRRQLLALAARHGKPVIEDAFEMDLSYSGRLIRPLAALDRHGLVVHLFSFSKSLFPGARVGSIAARGRAVDGLRALKHSADLSDSLPMQAAIAEFVGSGGYDRHLRRLRRRLRSRRDALMEALAESMPAGTRWTRPDGGYQVWVELPYEVDTRDLLADASRAGVLFAPGSQFLCDGSASRCMRLTVAQADESQIRRGVEALGKVVLERLHADPTARQAASVHV